MKNLSLQMSKISSLMGGNTIFVPPVSVPCQICGKQSNYTCFNCQSVNYCNKQHQQQDWKNSHKMNCKKKQIKLNDKNQQLIKQIYDARKNYYENYGNKIFTHCLLDSKLMTGLSHQLLQLQPQNIRYQLQYGASICLLVRTYRLNNDISSSKHVMQDYLKSRRKFLYDIQKYSTIMHSSNISQQIKQQLQMKLNLISGIANLSYVIGLNATEYYVLYTNYIIECFGEDSFQASNCYFLMGCFFAEEGWFLKAIACFEKAAKIRGQFAGDCMYNIGVLNKLLGNLPKALQTLQIALKLRQQQYGQDSNQVAQVNQLMGNIFTDQNDFKTAIGQFQKAFKVRSTNPYSPQYQNILELIHQLYNKLCLYIKIGQPNMKRPQIYLHLKQQIQAQTAFWQNQKYKKNKKQQQQTQKQQVDPNNNTSQKFKKKKTNVQDIGKKFSWKDSGLFHINQQFVATLNLSQLYRLSELQLELETCQSIFELAYIIGTSVFFEGLRQEKKDQLELTNKKLFELMRTEDIIKIKNKDK